MLNDPATRNALSDAMVVGLYEACLRAQQDSTLRVVILTGAPGAFSAGGSLGRFASAIGQPLRNRCIDVVRTQQVNAARARVTERHQRVKRHGELFA